MCRVAIKTVEGTFVLSDFLSKLINFSSNFLGEWTPNLDAWATAEVSIGLWHVPKKSALTSQGLRYDDLVLKILMLDNSRAVGFYLTSTACCSYCNSICIDKDLVTIVKLAACHTSDSSRADKYMSLTLGNIIYCFAWMYFVALYSTSHTLSTLGSLHCTWIYFDLKRNNDAACQYSYQVFHVFTMILAPDVDLRNVHNSWILYTRCR